MKLCRYGAPGRERPGLIDSDDAIRDLSAIVEEIDGAWLATNGPDELASRDISDFPRVEQDVRLGVPIAGVGKIVCAGMNYSDHCEEAGFPIPEEPALFMKATSSLCGPNDDILLPVGATQVDWEIELAVVIGRRGTNIPEATATDHIAGYTILNDVSDRDFQFNRGGQWFKGKSADTFCPVGPWLVTRDEVGDPQALEMWLDLNGVRKQTGHTANMIFPVTNLIAHISEFMTLEPGDIVSTGTPPGVGMGQKPEPQYLSSGDTMSLGINGLGAQEQCAVSPAISS